VVFQSQQKRLAQFPRHRGLFVRQFVVAFDQFVQNGLTLFNRNVATAAMDQMYDMLISRRVNVFHNHLPAKNAS
jgi:hypothetical protein